MSFGLSKLSVSGILGIRRLSRSFWNVVLNIFFLILINLFIKRVAPKSALTQGEMITIYAMLSIASGLAGHDTLALTIPALPHAFWFATLENDWADMFHRLYPAASRCCR